MNPLTPGGHRLSPRLRQTLACLLEGDSEKQVAARLGLSQHTAHQYITALYRVFGVHSRSQLLAHLLRQLAAELSEQLLNGVVSENFSARALSTGAAAGPSGLRRAQIEIEERAQD